MINLKDKLKKTLNWIKENPTKSVLGIGLSALVATTSLKDNVHFGSVTLNNPQENQYVWGIWSETTIIGRNAKGNIHTIGLILGQNNFENNSKITGNMNAYGFIGGNRVFGEITGNMNAYGLIAGGNLLRENSKITGNISNKGILVRNNVAGFSLGSNDVKGLENYVVKGE